MPPEDQRMAEWRKRLRKMDDLALRTQTNKELQPNPLKRTAAEDEFARREKESGLAKAKARITELESQLADASKGLVWARWGTIAALVIAAVAILTLLAEFLRSMPN